MALQTPEGRYGGRSGHLAHSANVLHTVQIAGAEPLFSFRSGQGFNCSCCLPLLYNML